jgi:hypothetical protein
MGTPRRKLVISDVQSMSNSHVRMAAWRPIRQGPRSPQAVPARAVGALESGRTVLREGVRFRGHRAREDPKSACSFCQMAQGLLAPGHQRPPGGPAVVGGGSCGALSVAGGASGCGVCVAIAVAAPDELGCISCPVGPGGAGPVDGGCRLDPEQVRQHGGRELAGKVDERRRRPGMLATPRRRSRWLR